PSLPPFLPQEVALTVLARKGGLPPKEQASSLPSSPRFVAELPFDSVLKRMSVVYGYPSAGSSPSTLRVMTKGAFESVWGISTSIRGKDGKKKKKADDDEHLSEWDLKFWQSQVEHLAGKGLRVLAFAERIVEDEGEGGGEGGGRARTGRTGSGGRRRWSSWASWACSTPLGPR
ncbi:potassium sodium efflux p-type atpase, partial [Nannochloropsis gaditana]